MKASPVKSVLERLISGEINSLSLSDDYFYGLLKESWWPRLLFASLPYQDRRDDEGHAASVTALASDMLGTLGNSCGTVVADRSTVIAAALLHDIGWSCLTESERERLFENSLPPDEELYLRRRHERLGADLARRLMAECGCPNGLADRVAVLIDGHDTRNVYLSDEDGLLKDADRLWMLTDRGFEADLRRRGLSAHSWAEALYSRFKSEDGLFQQELKTAVLERCSELGEKSPAAETASVEEEKIKREKPLVLIAHYRVGWTDGVSLEIEKRRVVLEEMGFRVLLLSGPGSRGADFIIDELDFESEAVKKIARNAFGSLKDYETPHQLLRDIIQVSDIVESRLSEIIIQTEPDFIMTHNIFSHGRHIAAARAFYKVLKSYGAASLTTHHDFYWERDDYRVPSCAEIELFLSKYVPPRIEGMNHAVINSLASVELKKRTEIAAMIFPDTLDFSVPPWVKDSYNSDFLSDFDLREDDILVLQATRIVRRKGIELIPPLIRRLAEGGYLDRLRGRCLYNGKMITKDSRIVFMLAGYAEHEAAAYRDQLEVLMKEEGIEFRFLQPYIAAERGELSGRKVYSLFDTYPYADLVSYPSLYEGWGNQFIEAVFARKPVVLYEYPVYKSDIKPIGYDVVSMGCRAEKTEDELYRIPVECIDACSERIVEWLLSEKTAERLEHNFMLAERNNSYDYLRKLMRRSMAHYEDF